MRNQDGYLVGLIGSGIGPSLSPPLHEREADELGLRYRYRRWDLDVLGKPVSAIGELLTAARTAGYDGLNITHPGKQAVIEHLDGLSPDAVELGAVNAVVFTGGRAIGHNTDWSGFARSFSHGLADAPVDRVVLLGAGGAGAAVAHAMLILGAGVLRVLDVDLRRSEALAESLRARFGADRAEAAPLDSVAEALAWADGFVHATPTGMAAHPGLPVPAELLRPGLWVADVVYRPLETELVLAARANGCRVLDGGGMAVFQAVDSFRLFTGVEPDAVRMLRHFAELAGGVHVHP
ncbi:shikimate dehydrogenase [Saccharopolyspora shandongensis]|uniref:shikimate dehydrogenase n=1 Tax=Saccharopolyspora shandongensis TaxID=418495 RepID=UPI0034021054